MEIDRHRATLQKVVAMPESELPPRHGDSAPRLRRYAQESAAARSQRTTTSTTERIMKMAENKTPKQSAREQAVPDVYLSEAGNFKPGLDARYKSDLIASVLGTSTKAEAAKMLHAFDAADAEKRLEQRGWTKFLARKREVLAAKAKAKNSKPAKAETAKAEPAKAEPAKAPDVTPDPKPSRRRGVKRAR